MIAQLVQYAHASLSAKDPSAEAMITRRVHYISMYIKITRVANCQLGLLACVSLSLLFTGTFMYVLNIVCHSAFPPSILQDIGTMASSKDVCRIGTQLTRLQSWKRKPMCRERCKNYSECQSAPIPDSRRIIFFVHRGFALVPGLISQPDLGQDTT